MLRRVRAIIVEVEQQYVSHIVCVFFKFYLFSLFILRRCQFYIKALLT
jgi:hypothetical protein